MRSQLKIHAFQRQYANSTRSELQILEKAQSRDGEILASLHTLKCDIATRDRKRTEIEASIEQRDVKIRELNLKISDIMNGLYDHEQIKVKSEPKKVLKESPDIVISKPDEKDEERRLRKDFRYYQKVVDRIDETLPEKFRLNLENMPMNKGYIWKGCWYYGLLQEERNQPTIMFERLYGGMMRIHEINSHEHIIYEKSGNKNLPKKLVSRKRRLVKKYRNF